MKRLWLIAAVAAGAWGCEVAADEPASCGGMGDCPDALACVGGRCVACQSAAQCGGGLVCADGRCRGCGADAECGAGELCRVGQCRPHLIAAMQADGRFAAFLQFVDAAGLRDDLAGRDELTVFAPVNASFGVLSQACLTELQFDDEAMGALVRASVGLNVGAIDAAGLRRAAEANAQIPVEALTSLQAGIANDRVTLDGLPVADTVRGANGFAHAVEGGVFLPPEGLPPECAAP